MRVCDFIAEFLVNHGVKYIHGLMGGGASGLNDGFISNKNLEYICYHHEQAAGHAAIGESKYTGRIAVVNPTTGCGGTNCMTSVLNAWQDSVPVIFISGNVKKEHCTNYLLQTQGLMLRKYGVQEHDIVKSVESITKMNVFINSIESVEYFLNEAVTIATSKRPGPVWIDVPSDIQTGIFTSNNVKNIEHTLQRMDKEDKEIVEDKIDFSRRPLILAGAGIRQANAVDLFVKFVEKYNIPFVSTYGARDYLPFNHSLNIGTVGIKGSRAGNFALQNSDLLLVLGSSLSPSVIGYEPKQLNKCEKIVVNCSLNDMWKQKATGRYNLDLKEFFIGMLSDE
jgi:acetolactate synthase-1/2/3 large subunit